MKPFIEILIMILCIALLGTCKKSEISYELKNNYSIDDQKSLKKDHGQVFIVSIEGDFTENLFNAFNQAIVAGSGSIVQVPAGNFSISRPVVIADFNGIFRGAGKDLTTITNIDDIPFPLIPDWPGFEWESSTLFNFYQTTGTKASLKISDITFGVKGESELWPGTDWGNSFHQIVGVYGQFNGSRDMQPSKLDCTFENVGFTAEMSDDFMQYNGNSGIQLWGEFFPDTWESEFITGTYIFRNCSFKNLLTAIGGGTILNSTLIMGGAQGAGNIFEDVWTAVLGVDFSNSVAEYSFNKFKNVRSAGICITQGYSYLLPGQTLASSEIYIKHNDFHVIEYGDGIVLEDYPYFNDQRQTLTAELSENHINLDNTMFRGIYGWYAQNVLVKENIIAGKGLAAIAAGTCRNVECADGESNLCSGWKIIGNTVKDVNADVAPIWLGPGSSQCLVVSDRNLTTILDEGSKNKLINKIKYAPKKTFIRQGFKREMPDRRGHRF